NLKKTACLASYVMSLHFFLLGALPGALSELLNGTRTALSIYTRSSLLAFSFLGFYAIVLFTVPDNLVEALPFISSLSITTGLYFHQGIPMRLFNLAGWICWLIYSISVFSIGGIMVFSILLVTTTITIFRLRRNGP
ncbi:MAG TPA: YgjV family protein, partial [Alphaproteobacteria bacterium]